jgi:transposase InsO family protein
MRWKSHVRFGRRAAETDRSKDRHRAAARPHTEHPTAEGKVYCAAVLDVFSRVVVGWSIADHMRAELVVDALEMARWRRRPEPGAVVHSDRGSQPSTRRGSSATGCGQPGCWARWAGSPPASTTA